MIVLGIRTDKPEAELYLYDVKGRAVEGMSYRAKATIKWQAHRQLAETIHKQIDKLLNTPAPGSLGEGGSNTSLTDIEGIICFKGPGSFTGLRIGLGVANTLAYAKNVPIVATKGDNWNERGIKQLLNGQNDKIAIPFYGRPPNTTKPVK